MRGIWEVDRKKNKETRSNESEDTPPNDLHEVTGGEDEESAHERAEIQDRMKEGDRLKSLARMEKRVEKKKKAEIRKKEMKTKSKQDNDVDERGTQEGERKKQPYRIKLIQNYPTEGMDTR